MTDAQSLAYRALDRHVIHGRADEIAFAGVGRPMTYAHLLHDSASIAGALVAIGVAAGTRVVIDVPSDRERVIAVLACTRIGAEIHDQGEVTLSGEPPALAAADTEVPWGVLLRAGRGDPAPAPAEDPEGYEQRLVALFPDVFATLLAGETLT